MKKYISFILSILLAFSLVSCAQNDSGNQNTLVEAYKSKTAEFVESGDIESAIKVLEEGVSTTGDAELKKMLDDLKSDNTSNVSSEIKDESLVDSSKSDMTSKIDDNVESSSEAISSIESTVSQTFDINDYIGLWTETEDVYSTGGMWLDIYDDGGDFLSFSIALVQSSGTREASTDYLMILKYDIKNNTIRSTFTDSFGNCGVVNIEFLEDKLICTVSNLQEPAEGADWGIYNGDYVLKYHTTEH